MRATRGRARPAPKTDLQSRLRCIEDRATAIQEAAGGGSGAPAAADGGVAELAYLVRYLAGIIGKHLQDGEN